MDKPIKKISMEIYNQYNKKMGIFNDHETRTSSEKGERGPPGIGFKLTINGDFDIIEKRLTNVSSAVENKDAITKNN